VKTTPSTKEEKRKKKKGRKTVGLLLDYIKERIEQYPGVDGRDEWRSSSSSN
jgi:hypothetical protein